MDAVNIFNQYIFDNSDFGASSAFEKQILSDEKLKSEFLAYLDKLGSKFMISRPKEALTSFIHGRLDNNDCSILLRLLQFETKWAYGFKQYISEISKETGYDSKLFLFDSYVKGELSKSAKTLFELFMNNSPEFASDFEVYLFTVDGICREADQDNLDFGIALKNLSKDQLREIVGKKEPERVAAAAADYTPLMEKSTKHRFKPWLWQAASIAAIAIIAFMAIFNIEKNSRQSVDNVIFACADINPELTRGSGKPIDIKAMSDDKLKATLPELESLYQSASTPGEIADSGYALAMAYLRLHNREKAKEVLGQLVSRFERDPDFADSVYIWKSTLNELK